MPPMRPQRGKTPRKRNGTNGTTQDPVEVYCRIRPLDNPDDPVCIKAISSSIVQLISNENSTAFARTGQLKEYQYKFQTVFDEYTSQKAIFDYVALPLMEDLIHGKNGLLFTYGITSSGKTYTMTGTPQDQGMLPRCLDVLFNSIGHYQSKKYVFKPDKMNGYEVQSEADAMMERQKKDIIPGIIPGTPGNPRKEKTDFQVDSGRIIDPSKITDIDEDNTFAVFVSYIEIYNNYVYDLLEELPFDPITGYKPPQSKILRTDAGDSMYVMSCTEVEIKSPEEAFEVLYRGQKRRKVAHTSLNAESSRSHSIFNIRLVQGPLDIRGEEVLQDSDRLCVSQLSLVDLAGSERTNRTKNQGDRLKEAGNINQTLMVLRTCLEVLRENQKNGTNKMVPYRDSKLTHLFKNYFEGDGRVRMIVCVNPRAEEYDETVHVMKFAEITQEVLITRSQQVKFDIGLTPGRRRMNEQFTETVAKAREADIEPSLLPSITYSLGAGFPNFELLGPDDNMTLARLEDYLQDRYERRQTLQIDLESRIDQFRNRLVEFERDYTRLMARNDELENILNRRDSNVTKVESKCRNLESRVSTLQQQLNETEKGKRELELKLQDKTLRLKQERSEKDRMEKDFRTRIETNNNHWERILDEERQKIEKEYGIQLKKQAITMNKLRDVLEENTFKTPVSTSVKTRTYTTPGMIQTARSESDVSSIGSIPTPTPRNRTNSAIPTARPVQGLNRQGATVTPVTTPRSTPIYNFRHRRSRSNNEVWLDHKPSGSVALDTVLQPSLPRKKSVTKLDEKDTKVATKYMLTHQEHGSDGEFQTKYFKGSVIPTSGGGAQVVFDDVEVHKQTSPGTRKRRSSCPQPTDFDGEWTDTETRCAVAIEGHSKKRSRPSPERVSRV
ncbi:hypothetical protein CHS0354_027020 [Potamilus streckersoni]|uniref:Kinesin-like protein n=1 Tax=Potamilus streckersoni TaxID=2493646 RepID=A0AAE0T1D8_9BIVA|nr:hypothetical protein CHS0354_027020 [Potamilus streckersoni]